MKIKLIDSKHATKTITLKLKQPKRKRCVDCHKPLFGADTLCNRCDQENFEIPDPFWD